MHPDRVVIGADAGDEEAGDAVAALYEPLGGEIVRTDVASAEMIKLASNAFLATKISFVNEIANVCEEVGADVAEVARGMGLDQRIGSSFLRAGIGYGGSCFPKDVSALKMLAGNTGYHFQLLNAVIEVNELQKRRVVRSCSSTSARWSAAGSRCSASPSSRDTDDMREASSLVLAARLQGEGAEVVAYDPVAGRGGPRPARRRSSSRDSALEALDGADAAVLVTEWPEFAELDWAEAASRMARPLLVDGRNFLDADALSVGRLRIRGDRPRRRGRPVADSRRLSHAGDRPGRRRGDAAAAADRDGAEAGADPGRPALPRLHDRVARRPRRRPRSCSPAASCPTSCARRCGEEERAGVADPLRRRARAAGHRRGDPLRRRRSSATSSTSASSPSTATCSPTST